MPFCDCAVAKKGSAGDPLLKASPLKGELQMTPRPAVAKAAVRPRNSRNAGARRSKARSKFTRDMTHTFQLDPQAIEGVSYLNTAQIGNGQAIFKPSLRRLDMKLW